MPRRTGTLERFTWSSVEEGISDSDGASESMCGETSVDRNGCD